MKIPLTRPYFDSDEISEIKKVLDSGWVSQGPKVAEFEKLVSEYLGIRNVIAVSNCTAGLHLSLLSFNIGEGDEVIVPDFTFPATGHSVLYTGAKPVFVDVQKDTYNICPKKLIDKINERTKAIIPVHTFGNSVDMDQIIKISKEYNIKIIEDAACGLGSEYKGHKAGTLGDIGNFSLHGRKGITTGEGGLVVTNNDSLASQIRILSAFGMQTAWNRDNADAFSIPKFTDLGYNYKMSDISAAVGISQLRKIDSLIDRKIELAKYWNMQLSNIPEIITPNVRNFSKHIYQSYVVYVNPVIDRNNLIEKLKQEGIQTQIGYYSSNIQPVYHSKDICPVSEDLYNQALALPMFYELREDQIDYICLKLKGIIEVMK